MPKLKPKRFFPPPARRLAGGRVPLLPAGALAFALLLAPALAWAQPMTMVPAPPRLAATSYVLADMSSGDILVESNADQRLPPASLTKIMTGYVAAEAVARGIISEDDQVAVSVRAWRAEGSRTFLEEGSEVDLMDIMRGVVIQSGNDASIALAEHMANDEAAFADLMNQQARYLGMASTHFANATGLPDPDHYTSARDLARLTRALIRRHPQHYRLYAERSFTYNNIRQRNRNRLLWRDPSVDGVKTGHTEEAGYCLVASAQRDDTRFITVVMGSASEDKRLEETQRLLAYGFRHFETVSFYGPMKAVRALRVWGGEASVVQVGLPETMAVTLPKGLKSQLTTAITTVPELHAPVAAGQEIGTLTVTLPDGKQHAKPLVALGAVKEAGFFAWLLDAAWLFTLKLFGQDPLEVS